MTAIAPFQLPAGAVVLPFSKLKPGMRVGAPHLDDEGTLLAKHKGTESVTILWDKESAPFSGIEWQAAGMYVLAVDPLDQIHPMLAKNIKDYSGLTVEQLIANDAWVFEKKYDGFRQILAFVPDGMRPGGEKGKDWAAYGVSDVSFRATSRVVGKNTGRLGVSTFHLIDHGDYLTRGMPDDGITVFDGEVMHTKYGNDDEANFKLVSSIMQSLPPKAAAAQQAEGYVSLRLYDVLWFNGVDMRGQPFAVRRAVLESWWTETFGVLFTRLKDSSSTAEFFRNHISIAPQARSAAEKAALLEQSALEGWEGLMCKRRDGVYTDTTKKEQRSPALLKHKPFDDTEVIIVGFEQGQGEYNKHEFGAIRFAQWVPRDKVTAAMSEFEVPCGVSQQNVKLRRSLEDAQRSGMWASHALIEVGTASGFSKAQEAEFRANPDAFIAEVATVKYQQRWQDTGRMRHAHFKAMRPSVWAGAVIYTPEQQ